MEEELNVSAEDAALFNAGYYFSQFKPELADALKSTLQVENKSLNALKAGIGQSEKEASEKEVNNKEFPWMDRDNYADPELDRGIDDIEPEIG